MQCPAVDASLNVECVGCIVSNIELRFIGLGLRIVEQRAPSAGSVADGDAGVRYRYVGRIDDDIHGKISTDFNLRNLAGYENALHGNLGLIRCLRNRKIAFPAGGEHHHNQTHHCVQFVHIMHSDHQAKRRILNEPFCAKT